MNTTALFCTKSKYLSCFAVVAFNTIFSWLLHVRGNINLIKHTTPELIDGYIL
jgi:hypothetical protein